MPVDWKTWLQERKETPAFLKRTWEKRLVGVIGDVFNDISDKLVRARAVGWPHHPLCPADAQDIKGRERGIPRRPGEPNDDYGLRLNKAFETWSNAGFKTQLEGEISGYGFTGAFIIGTHEWDGATYPAFADPSEYDNWSRFWVYVPHTGHNIEPDGNWDDPGDWDDGGLWDFENLTLQIVHDIRNLLDLYRPGHEIPVRVRFLLAPGHFTLVDTWSGGSVAFDLYAD